jgi:hypothetical protein
VRLPLWTLVGPVKDHAVTASYPATTRSAIAGGVGTPLCRTQPARAREDKERQGSKAGRGAGGEGTRLGRREEGSDERSESAWKSGDEGSGGERTGLGRREEGSERSEANALGRGGTRVRKSGDEGWEEWGERTRTSEARALGRGGDEARESRGKGLGGARRESSDERGKKTQSSGERARRSSPDPTTVDVLQREAVRLRYACSAAAVRAGWCGISPSSVNFLSACRCQLRAGSRPAAPGRRQLRLRLSIGLLMCFPSVVG